MTHRVNVREQVGSELGWISLTNSLTVATVSGDSSTISAALYNLILEQYDTHGNIEKLSSSVLPTDTISL